MVSYPYICKDTQGKGYIFWTLWWTWYVLVPPRFLFHEGHVATAAADALPDNSIQLAGPSGIALAAESCHTQGLALSWDGPH